MNAPKPYSPIPALALRAVAIAVAFVLMTLGLPSIKSALAEETPSASPTAKTQPKDLPSEEGEEQPEPLPDPFPDMTANVRTTLLDPKGHSSTTIVKVYRTGNIVRYEHNDIDPPEVSIMNYEENKDYRIYDKDEMYFETDISVRIIAKAQRNGLIPLQGIKGLTKETIFLREALVDGHPCDIVLRIRYAKDRRELGTEYTLVWEARDMKRQPIRVAYYQINLSLVIVEYSDIKLTPIDPDLIKPPPEYMSLSPF